MKRIATAALIAAALSVGAPAVAHADPLRCKDTPGNLPGMTFHVCQLPGGMINSCMSAPGPIMGDPCRQYPASSLPPDFWN